MKGSLKRKTQPNKSALSLMAKPYDIQVALAHTSQRRHLKAEGRSTALVGAALCLPLLLLPAIWPSSAAAAAVEAAPQASSLPAAQQSIEVKQSAPYFKALPQTGDRASLGVNYYEAAGSPLNVTGRSGELLQAVTPGGEQAYVPVWYTENAASETQAAKPMILQLKPTAQLYLFPGSQAHWSGDYASSGLISALRWGDWYGVVLPANPGYAGGSVIRPSLLWVESSQIASTQQAVTGLLSTDSTVPIEMAKSLIETSLPVGTPEQQVRDLLGEPYSRTALPHSATSDPAGSKQRGELWRYERGDVQFTVSLDTAHRLASWNWILPTSEASQSQLNPNQPPYAFTYDFRLLDPVPSIKPQTLWQAQSDLDAQYLLVASDDALLIQGDQTQPDGKPAEEGLYALDRISGKPLWHRETGDGGFEAQFSEDKSSVLLLVQADPNKEQLPMLYSVRLSDGSVRWSREADSKSQQGASPSPRLSLAGTSVLVSNQPNGSEKGLLTVRSQRSGAVRWTKEFAEPYTLLNQGSDDPYVLVQQKHWIQALDPRSGRAIWSLKTDTDTLPNPYGSLELAGGPRMDPFDRGDGTRWITFGGDWIRLNTATGDILARYAIASNERVDMPSSRYLVVRRAMDSADYDSGSLFETMLYDTQTQQEVWSVPGKLSQTLLEEDRLYGLLGGVPAALSLENGQPLWKTPTSEFAWTAPGRDVQAGSFVHTGRILLLPYGPDLLTFDAATGEPLRRIDGVSIAYVENKAQLIQNGTLNRDGDTLYVGSANGTFAALDANVLTEQVEKNDSDQD
ncbi:hypothetical protein B9G55_20155 [Saccharibacillus sp. O16]|nr:hypothetical protein B9G55_20155 [Saccharibacillus sp. O16]